MRRSLYFSDFEALLRTYEDTCTVQGGDPGYEIHDESLYVPASVEVYRGPGGQPQFSGGIFDRWGAPVESANIVRVRRRLNSASGTSAETAASSASSRVEGTGVYLGWLIGGYGHGLLETMARAWAMTEPLVRECDFAVLHLPYWSKLAPLPEFLQYLLDRLAVPRLVAPEHPTWFRRLIVPHAAFEIRTCAYRSFLRAFPRAKATDHRPLYVSRSRLPSDQRSVVGEDILERYLDDYDVIYPETLPIKQQIAAFQGHRRIVGVIGSAMHGLLFTETPEPVYLTHEQPNYNFFMCDDLVQANSLYVHCCDFGDLPEFGRTAPYRLDLARVADALGLFVDTGLQELIDARHREVWARARLSHALKQGDSSAVAEVERHLSGTQLPPDVIRLAAQVAETAGRGMAGRRDPGG